MPVTSSPPSRRRGFSTLALLTSGALLFSSTSAGLYALATSAKAGIAQLERRPDGPFTQSPTRAFLGLHPGRDPHGRGGMWTAAMRRVARASTRTEGLFAGQGISPEQPHTLAVSADPGASYPWEGSAPSAGGSVNTGNGNKLTSIHLLDWKVRGGGTLDFTLYHNSQTNYSDELGAGWTWTYDVYINDLTTTPTVHWGDGTSIPYSGSGGGGLGPPPGVEARMERTLYAALGDFAFMLTGTTYTPPAGVHDTLVQNADGTWTVTKKDGTLYAFNAAGFLTSVTDRDGNAIALTLNAQNYVTRITDPTGRYVSVTLGAGNKFTGITDSTGRSWTFALNGSGDLSSVTWPDLGDGHTYADAFAYSSHRITTHTDRRGKAWTFGYNSDGSLASETDPLGHGRTYTYGSSATTVTDALGHASTDNYSSGVQASHVDESGYSVSYTSRDANYDVTAWTDARGKSWSATYDAMGNVLTKTDPLGHATTTTYNGFAEPLTVTDALGHATTYAYGASGDLLTVTNALNKTVLTNAYGSFGLLSSATDALGHATTYSYDANGNATVVTDPTGVATTTGYDALSRPTGVTDGAGNTVTTGYDAWERPTTTVYPSTGGAASPTRTVAYLPTGETRSVTDELGHATTDGYDDAGRLTSVTNALGDVEGYGYDAADRRTSVTNGRGKVRTYAFTNRGDVSSLTMPDGAAESWSYDGAGNATAYVNGLNQTILYTFDDAGRETLVDYPTGTDTTFGYDAAGRRTSMADATGSTTWAYDAANRETTFAAPQGSQTSGYDDAGRRTSLTGTGIARTWSYDGAGRALTLGNESSETTSFAYDAAGRLSTTTLANGQVSTVGYDARGRQTSTVHRASASGATLASESDAYDDAGNLSSKTADGTTTTYGYDAADQLTSESRTGYAASYAYDANGNRTSKTLNGVTDSYAVDDGDKLTSVTEGSTTVKSYGYDAAGRTTSVVSSAGTTTLAYDYESRVASISGPGVSDSFTYNGLDTRVGKVEASGTRTFRRDGAEVTDDVLSDGAATYTPGVSQRRGGATTYDLHDQLGTATRQTDASATLTATRTYDAFGGLLASTGTPQGPFGFAASSGYQEDGDSGLKLLGHRYYDPSTGRFLTRDPVKDGRNWYVYCESNPLQSVDPTGLDWIPSPGHPGFQTDPSTGQTRPTPGGPFDLPPLGPPKPQPKPPVSTTGPKGGDQGPNDPGNYSGVTGKAPGVKSALSDTGQVTVSASVDGPGGSNVTATPPQNGQPGSVSGTAPVGGTGSVTGTFGPHQPPKISITLHWKVGDPKRWHF